MKFTVEQWKPEYGSPVEDLDDGAATISIDPEVERAAGEWEGIPADKGCFAETLVFVDGVRRIDARIWLDRESGVVSGLCASCAAGIVRCDGAALVEHALVHRVLVAPSPEEAVVTRHASYLPHATTDGQTNTLMNGLAQALSALEVQVAQLAEDAPLIVLDGPLRGREQVKCAIGYVKTHEVAYLKDELAATISRLKAAERTPVFSVETSWTRYSWYLRLPFGEGHPWAGIVRCEAPPNLSTYQVIDVANTTVATLPAFASSPHRDPRAPQNLYPIGGLESLLRSRLGDAELLYRSILLSSRQA